MFTDGINYTIHVNIVTLGLTKQRFYYKGNVVPGAIVDQQIPDPIIREILHQTFNFDDLYKTL